MQARQFGHFLVTALLLIGLLSGHGMAQLTLDVQDLTQATITSSVAHAGDFAVDGAGNTWILTVQSTPGGITGSIARISPTGVYTPNVQTFLSEVGQLIRGSDGGIYFWMNVTSTATSLCRLSTAGILVGGTIFAGFLGAGCAEDAAGNFYVGLKVGSGTQTGIWRYAPAAVNLVPYSNGIPGDNLRLAITPSGRFFTANGVVVNEVLPSGATTQVVTVNQLYGLTTPCTICTLSISDLDSGFYDDVLVVTNRLNLLNNTRTAWVFSLNGVPGSFVRIAQTPVGTTTPPGHICLGLPGGPPQHFVLHQNQIWRTSGSPAILFVSRPTPVQLRLDLLGPAGGFILALDAPGISLPIAGFGTFHTSLGSSPAFWAVLDWFGLFGAASPFAVAPFTTTFPLGTYGATIVLEAYLPSPLAANSILLISNFVTLAI